MNVSDGHHYVHREIESFSLDASPWPWKDIRSRWWFVDSRWPGDLGASVMVAACECWSWRMMSLLAMR